MAVDKNDEPGAERRVPFGPPEGNKILKESLTFLQVPRLAFRSPSLLLRTPTGTKQPALFIPGLKASDASTAPLRAFLNAKNYATYGWGFGTNRGNVSELLPKVTARAEELFERSGEPIALVGWSLGGLIGREVARDRPELVSQVVTYGTPVVGGALYTSVTGVYTMEERRAMAERIAERNRTPIEVPITAMYSKRDGIVSWRACIDDFSPDITMIEISSTHVGMGIDPDVWRVVAERLAA